MVASELARALLEKGRHDLIAAELTIVSDEALDTVCFHAQQAAEKALKALLALDDIAFPHTHDLAGSSNLSDLPTPNWRNWPRSSPT
jgi:HEPN domain-containing protein